MIKISKDLDFESLREKDKEFTPNIPKAIDNAIIGWVKKNLNKKIN